MVNNDYKAIRKFYSTLIRTDRIEANCLFHSKVYYTRWAIRERTGVDYALEHVNIAMCLEGLLPPEELKDLPEWYIEKFYGGVTPDMAELRAYAAKKYRAKHPAPVSEKLAAGEQGVPWKT